MLANYTESKTTLRSLFKNEVYYNYDMNGQKKKKDKHMANKGYDHKYTNSQEEYRTSKMACSVCQKPYHWHLDSGIGFKSGYWTNAFQQNKEKRTLRLKRVHSFHEHEKLEMREFEDKDDIILKYRIKEAHKDLSNKENFYCEICYSDVEIKNIAII